MDLVPTEDEICCMLQLGWSNVTLLGAAFTHGVTLSLIARRDNAERPR